MRHLMLILQYRGTNYCGFQVQPNGVSVAQVVQDAIETVFKRRWPVKGCSRTDAGVHANHFVLAFFTDAPIPCDAVVRALNIHLPPDGRFQRGSIPVTTVQANGICTRSGTAR